MKKIRHALIIGAIVATADSAGATGVLVTFSAVIDSADPALAGTIDAGDVVTGNFIFDPGVATPLINPSEPNSRSYSPALREFGMIAGDNYSIGFTTGAKVASGLMGVANDYDYGPRGIADGFTVQASRVIGAPINGAALLDVDVRVYSGDLSLLSSLEMPTAEEVNSFVPSLLHPEFPGEIAWLGTEGGSYVIYKAYWSITGISATSVVVPEPSTAILLGLGLVGMSLRRPAGFRRGAE